MVGCRMAGWCRGAVLPWQVVGFVSHGIDDSVGCIIIVTLPRIGERIQRINGLAGATTASRQAKSCPLKFSNVELCAHLSLRQMVQSGMEYRGTSVG